MDSSMLAMQGPPYAPTTALAGGLPTVSVDVPICAVFIALFAIGAAGHMTIFQLNRRKGHKFIPSAATFGFCMARIVTNSLRIAWACHPTNIRLAMAAQIFVAAGVLVLFILNLLFTQRVLRAFHPRVGWSPAFSYFFKALYVIIVFSLAMLITVVVQSFYTLNPNTHRIDRDVEFYGYAYFVMFSFLPFPMLAYTLLVPRKNGEQIDHFGKGSWSAKFIILGVTTFLLSLGATFRAAINYKTPRPLNDPAWYDHKACFYVFNFTIEILVVYIYLLGRVDQRFYVPDGSSKVRHYGGLPAESEGKATS
ncbi:hypothetical protein VTN77DRAFT_8646 [Rasamsonia byssochlamydoides]|uniref:uncharacterized protein n=1 Tax=Rasamsonia byssochlamydoides TaxID=89139 RepID=UPI003743D284